MNQSYSVFLVSWTKPDATLRDTGMEHGRYRVLCDAPGNYVKQT